MEVRICIWTRSFDKVGAYCTSNIARRIQARQKEHEVSCMGWDAKRSRPTWLGVIMDGLEWFEFCNVGRIASMAILEQELI